MLNINESELEFEFSWTNENCNRSLMIYNNKKDCNFGEELQQLLLVKEDKPVTLVDVRSLRNTEDVRKMMATLPEGFVILDHLTGVPNNEYQELIFNHLRYLIKGDWRNSTAIPTSDYEEHLFHTKLVIYVIVDGDVNLPAKFNLASLNIGVVAYGEGKDDNFWRIDREK